MRFRAWVAMTFGVLVAACGWNPSRPFDRDAPVVTDAVRELDAGDASSAASQLEDYLSTGPCKDGNIGTPDLLKRRPDGTLDLGLSLFRIGEAYGHRFGDEESPGEVDEGTRDLRHTQIECAKRLLQAVEDDDNVDADLRAQARYLEGNLDFLDGDYEDAVKAYDRALKIAPGEIDADVTVGRDAAWNRAIALRRIDDKKDAGDDASRDASQDAASGGDSGRDTPRDAASPNDHDASNGPPDAGDNGSRDSGAPPPSEPDAAGPPDAGPPPPPADEDERMLDQLENAPTFQQEEAKRAGRKPVRGMADK